MIKCNLLTFENACQEVCSTLSLTGDNLMVEVDLVDEETIRQLNCNFRGVDKATDVLSFALLEVDPSVRHFAKGDFLFEYSKECEAILLGNVVICKSIATSQAEEYGNTLEKELNFLFVHGLLHLLGYDHIEENDRQLMRQKENDIASNLSKRRR